MEWKKLNWIEIQGRLYLLQQRIYNHSKIGNIKEVVRLQEEII